MILFLTGSYLPFELFKLALLQLFGLLFELFVLLLIQCNIDSEPDVRCTPDSPPDISSNSLAIVESPVAAPPNAWDEVDEKAKPEAEEKWSYKDVPD